LQRLETRCEELGKSLNDFKSELVSLISAIPSLSGEAAKDAILTNFSINGVTPMSRDEMRSFLSDIVSTAEARWGTQREELLREIKACLQHDGLAMDSPEVIRQSTVHHTGTVYSQLGQHPFFPNGYSLPSGQLKTMWDLWLRGHATAKVQPLHLLPIEHLSTFFPNRKAQQSFWKYRKLMLEMIDIGSEQKCVDIDKMTPAEQDTTFNKLFPVLLKKLYPEGPRGNPNEFVYSTYANRLYKRLKLT
jgi:hypothetical protein